MSNPYALTNAWTGVCHYGGTPHMKGPDCQKYHRAAQREDCDEEYPRRTRPNVYRDGMSVCDGVRPEELKQVA